MDTNSLSHRPTASLGKSFSPWAFALLSLSLGAMTGCSVREGELIGSSDAATLNIKESSGLSAEIFIDGQSTGLSTPAIVANIPEGKHILSLVKNGYAIAHDTTEYHSGSNSSKVLSLASLDQSADLQIQSNWAGARILIDGMDRGAAPLNLSGLSLGNHQIRIQKGNAIKDSTIHLQANATVQIEPVVQQWALLEHFSNVACLPCPSVEFAMEEYLHNAHDERLVHMAMHINSPSPDDIFYTPFASQINPRMNPEYYNVSSVPRVLLNGVKTGARQDSVNIPKYLNDSLPILLSRKAALNLNFEQIQNKLGSISGKLSINASEALSSTRVQIALVEDEIHFDQAPGINKLKDFTNMFRGFANLGQNPNALASGEIQVDFNIQHNLNGRPLSLIAWIEDPSTKTVLQTFKQKLSIPQP